MLDVEVLRLVLVDCEVDDVEVVVPAVFSMVIRGITVREVTSISTLVTVGFAAELFVPYIFVSNACSFAHVQPPDGVVRVV